MNDQLKILPSVSKVLHEVKHLTDINKRVLTVWIKQELSKLRIKAKNSKLEFDRKKIIHQIVLMVIKKSEGSLKPVINGTGIVLHTGLGRAPLHQRVIRNATRTLEGYSNLEFNLDTGKRGNRQSHLNDYFKGLTGTHSSLVVNNNAAAVLLGINTLANKKEVIVSRGQEVEIGGSFRIPDIIEKSGGILKEVGSTNRTHRKDIENAINSNTGLLLWVHTSNYKIQGFTKDISLETLVDIGRQKRLPVMADLGSGALDQVSDLGLPKEYPVREVVKLNPQIITFSGDKLLGGPQSGIILGSTNLMQKCIQNPIYRTIRCDKFTLSLLEETLKYNKDTNQANQNLTLSLLATPRKNLLKRVKRVIEALPQKVVRLYGISSVETEVEAGSGSLPVKTIPSAGMVFYSKKYKPSELAKIFRMCDPSIIGYIHGNKFFLDFKSVLPRQDKIITSIIQKFIS
ncbi:MAG: L-seryl-tRNA(Sec) selenium transferase [Candidatus Marinimicrobia bacterium]|nr:L-seryl-tRNA(Sec) selenium transferase [Candidatus Neomarinimicrobiota bacterium]|tara:strand:+ start:3398 stop:4768 length:1371 start_codon:yes stop_codon:yes gene_type:complete